MTTHTSAAPKVRLVRSLTERAAAYAPGDSIGNVVNGINYRTQWTLVEVRKDTASDQPYALLMNANGDLRRKDWDSDKNDPKQQELNTAVNGPADPNAPAPGPGGPARPPGTGPGGGGRPGGMPPPMS